MKIYLSGPMSNLPDFNFPAFHAAADKLRDQGHEVFNPAEEDLKKWGTLENVLKYFNYRECLKKDLSWICDNAEAIAILPGWEKSKGVGAELALAKALKLWEMYL